MENLFRPYKNLRFPLHKERPTYYANFVMTLDGKVFIKTKRAGYWPIGDTADRHALHTLRAHADVLIHGRKTAEQFPTLASLDTMEFRQLRKKANKPILLPYLVISTTMTKDLLKHLTSHHQPVFLATLERTKLPKTLSRKISVLRAGTTEVNLELVNRYLFKHGYHHALVEGGPTLMGSFVKQELIDELFLTVAPKLFGNKPGTTLGLIENYLVPAKRIPTGQLVSAHHVGDELFLRYRLQYGK